MELTVGDTVYWVDGDPLLKEGRIVDLSKIHMNKVGVTCEYPGSYPLMLTTNFVALSGPAAIQKEIRMVRRELGLAMDQEKLLLDLLFEDLGIGASDD